jgi:hypothetical protein
VQMGLEKVAQGVIFLVEGEDRSVWGALMDYHMRRE